MLTMLDVAMYVLIVASMYPSSAARAERERAVLCKQIACTITLDTNIDTVSLNTTLHHHLTSV